MDKRLRQADSESILSNNVFKEAINEYQNRWKEKIIQSQTPEDAFKAALAVQAADEFVRVLQGYVNDGIIASYNDQQKAKFEEPTQVRKIVR